MIIKKRSKPLILQKYEALQARLPKNSPHHREISREIEKIERGYQGELTVDYHLRILESKFTILQDVTLEIDRQTFQMDNLIITPHAMYIIEVKNFTRTITFDTNLNQFTSGDGNTYTGYRHPITQVKNQKLKLQQWLLEHNQPNIPIYYFVAISEPSTLINVVGDHDEISNIVMHSEHIPWRIMEYENTFVGRAAAGSQRSTTPKITHQKIGYKILRHCVEFDMDILSRYGIRPEQLLTGVRCYQCNRLGMERVKWDWICPKCQYTDRKAAMRSINDYLMLVKPWVENREIVRFLNLNSRHVVTRVLKSHPNLQLSKNRRRWIKVQQRHNLP